jgi:hypothetical protein
MSGLEESPGLEAIIRRYGRGTVVQDSEELAEYEWTDGDVRLRVTTSNGSYDIILWLDPFHAGRAEADHRVEYDKMRRQEGQGGE